MTVLLLVRSAPRKITTSRGDWDCGWEWGEYAGIIGMCFHLLLCIAFFLKLWNIDYEAIKERMQRRREKKEYEMGTGLGRTVGRRSRSRP